MVHRCECLLVVLAVLTYAVGAQQVDYYFLIPPDANNIDKPYLQFVVGETLEAQWHNPGNPINLYLTWCGGQNNQTLLDSVGNTGQASIQLDKSYLSDCGDYMLTVLGVQDGVMDWGQPTGSLPFNIVDVANSPNEVASLATIEVTDTDQAGFAAATAVVSLAVSGSSTTSPMSPTTTRSGSGNGGSGGGSGGGSSRRSSVGNGGGGKTSSASTTSISSNASLSAATSTVASGADSQASTTNPPASTNGSGLTAQAKVGLGVGIGLGIPLLALAYGFAWLWTRRHRSASDVPSRTPYGIETSQPPR